MGTLRPSEGASGQSQRERGASLYVGVTLGDHGPSGTEKSFKEYNNEVNRDLESWTVRVRSLVSGDSSIRVLCGPGVRVKGGALFVTDSSG